MTAWHRLRQQPWLVLWTPVGLWMALIFYLSAQPDLPHPTSSWLDLLVSSGAHVFLFGVLAILWARAIGGRPRRWLLILGLVVVYGFSDEFHQYFVPGRHADPWDLLCDALGAGLGLLVWTWLWQGLVRRTGRVHS
jgi:VanZ family protein